MNKIPFIGPMPAVGLGTWKLSGEKCEESVRTALELGYRHIDTADYYNNHTAIGKAIKSVPRDELFLVTKIVGGESDPLHACKRFLNELQTSYLDVLLIHWPTSRVHSKTALEAMINLKRSKLVRHIGVSNFTVENLEELDALQDSILTNQIELQPYLQENKLTQYCQGRNIIVTAYTPLQQGHIDACQQLQEICSKYNKTAAQIALRWLWQRNIVSIPKATTREHLQENIAIFDFALTADDMKAIAALERQQKFCFD